jgi:Flp pilus assembly protein TadG
MKLSAASVLQDGSLWPTAGRQRRGTTTAEVAVVSPVAFALVLGLVEIGRALMVMHLLNNAAVAGCRTAIIEGQDTTAVQSEVNSVLSATGISGATTTVTVNDASADASTANSGDEITVQVSVPYSSVSWLPSPSFVTGSLQTQFTMRRE